MTKPTAVFWTPLARRWAVGLGLNFKSLMAFSTRWTIVLLTVGSLLRTRETVVMDTFACRATSVMLIFLSTLIKSHDISHLEFTRLVFDVRGTDVFADLDDFQSGYYA